MFTQWLLLTQLARLGIPICNNLSLAFSDMFVA